MSRNELIPGLFGFTLIAVLIVAAVGLLYFLRKRSNRHPMDTPRGHEIERARDEEVRDARENDTRVN